MNPPYPQIGRAGPTVVELEKLESVLMQLAGHASILVEEQPGDREAARELSHRTLAAWYRGVTAAPVTWDQGRQALAAALTLLLDHLLEPDAVWTPTETIAH